MDRPGQSIVLIGMMGAGKSSVGHWLQRRTGLDLFDTDEAVSGKLGLSIPEIFGQFGEEKFRQTETEMLREFAPTKPTIVITGGGTIQHQENVQRLKQLGIVVWLDAGAEALFERAARRGDRPLLHTQDPHARFSALLQQRNPLYERAADVRIDTSKMDHNEVANAILIKIQELTAT